MSDPTVKIVKIYTLLTELQWDNVKLCQDNLALQQLIAQLREAQSTRAVITSSPPVPLKVSLPDKFDGNWQNFRGFINQVNLYFHMNPGVYDSDALKIGFLGGLLSGSALKWFSPLLEKESPLLENRRQFMAEFEAIFGDTDGIRTATTKLRALKQGNHSAATYASEFCQIATALDWNDAALADQFRDGLRSEVKDMMIGFPDPQELNDAITLAVRCDNRLFEHRQERWAESVPAAVLPSIPPPRINAGGVEPMQLDAVRFRQLSAAEKERHRANNLCLYCGLSGHIVRNCPNRFRVASMSAPLNQTPVSVPSANVTLLNTNVQMQ